jgi:uncharacterized protein YceK
MIKQAISAILMAAALLCGIGCGTIANLASGNPEVPYGGVQKDLTWLATPTSNEWGAGGSPAVVFILAAELGLSFVADTLTLPLALYIIHRE